MLLPSGNPFKSYEEVLSLQPMIPPKRFDISPPDWGMLKRSRRVSSDFSSNEYDYRKKREKKKIKNKKIKTENSKRDEEGEP